MLNVAKKLVILFVSMVSFFYLSTIFASSCPPATAANAPGFCSSFKVAAQCHCTSSGLPKGMCMNMKLVYDRMISMFGTVRRACEYQHDTSTQSCMDAWSCYRSGGNTSQNELCSGTGSACE